MAHPERSHKLVPRTFIGKVLLSIVIYSASLFIMSHFFHTLHQIWRVY